jgi:hypothetical protein
MGENRRCSPQNASAAPPPEECGHHSADPPQLRRARPRQLPRARPLLHLRLRAQQGRVPAATQAAPTGAAATRREERRAQGAPSGHRRGCSRQRHRGSSSSRLSRLASLISPGMWRRPHWPAAGCCRSGLNQTLESPGACSCCCCRRVLCPAAEGRRRRCPAPGPAAGGAHAEPQPHAQQRAGPGGLLLLGVAGQQRGGRAGRAG